MLFRSDVTVTDTPDGTTQYPFVSLLPGVNARWMGNYSIVAVASSLPSGSHTVTVTFHQFAYSGATDIPTTVARTFDAADVLNGMVVLDEVTLPGADLLTDSTEGYMTVSIDDTNGSSRYEAILLLDTMGVTMLVNTTAAYDEFYIDEPTATRDFSPVMAGDTRARAVSVLGETLGGGALLAAPGTSRLFVFSPSGIPEIAAKYRPHFYNEVLS